MENTTMKNTEDHLFDLEATYTIRFISQLFCITEKEALDFVDESGCLTPQGKHIFEQLNKLY